VEGNKFEQGMVMVNGPNDVLETAKKLYLKEISTLKLSPPAKPLLVHNGNVIMATVKYGKGAVFLVGDPWLYDEYTDGRKLPADYDNFKAAKDLSRWLLSQSRRN
jgi:unsaturated rhamnogalacturonyl hydrolase